MGGSHRFPANLTQQAFTVNMELGMLARGGTMPGRVEEQFRRPIQDGQLRTVQKPTQDLQYVTPAFTEPYISQPRVTDSEVRGTLSFMHRSQKECRQWLTGYEVG